MLGNIKEQMGIAACQLSSWEKGIFFKREKSLEELWFKKKSLNFLLRTLSYTLFFRDLKRDVKVLKVHSLLFYL